MRYAHTNIAARDWKKLSDFYIKASWEEIINPGKHPEESHIPMISSLFIFKRHYVVFLNLLDYQKKELTKMRSFCLVFKSNGELMNQWTVDSALRFFTLSRQGYLLGTKSDEI